MKNQKPPTRVGRKRGSIISFPHPKGPPPPPHRED